ncbi:hypothetical protein IE53DRAFT_383760 [Violaceomyces palustris]|uniref:Uncharacterized protein n=1 Tax=Violaceomyces palustris TaxID=1673888 RepID=A0ACD0P6P4_9BASI|nr:hypothetical protein IE53DRAFT_383760 [Violaceomyces palustris]
MASRFLKPLNLKGSLSKQAPPSEKAASLDDTERDERGYRVLKGKDRFDVTVGAFLSDKTNDEGRKRSTRIAYLEGIRGILGLQTLIWIFLRIFAPATVTDRDLDGKYPAVFTENQRSYEIVRKVLSPLLFDGSLQMTMFIILSGRVILQTFVERREAIALAGPAFRRPFRMVIPSAIALALVSVVAVLDGFKHAPYLSETLKNQIAQPPKIWGSTLEYFNSMITFFFAPEQIKTSRAVAFIPPAGISWYLEVVFQQVYVLIIYAFTLPYTIFRYKNLGSIAMILITAWVGKWSWYTLTGLVIAEYSVVYKQILPAKGLPIDRKGKKHVPVWLFPTLFTLLGIFFKYLWISILPEKRDAELVAHVNGNTGKLNHNFNSTKYAYPRYDDWLLSMGILMLIEISGKARGFLSWKPFVHLGRLSFSIALISGTIMLSLGSLIFHHLSSNLGWSINTIVGVEFLILIPLCLVSAEIFSRVVDDASLFIAKVLFNFARN